MLRRDLLKSILALPAFSLIEFQDLKLLYTGKQ